MKQTRVKLVLYEDRGEKTMIDIHEAQEFKDFFLVIVPSSQLQDQHFLEQMHHTFGNSEKKIIIMSQDSDVRFYGVRVEEDDNRPTDSELQYEESSSETS